MRPSLTMLPRINTISDPPPHGRHRDTVCEVSIHQGWSSIAICCGASGFSGLPEAEN